MAATKATKEQTGIPLEIVKSFDIAKRF